MKQNPTDLDLNKMRSEGNELIPNKYKLHLPLTATQIERLHFLWDLGYRKISKELLDEINFSQVHPVALSGVGANYGEFILSKAMAEQDFVLTKVGHEESVSETPIEDTKTKPKTKNKPTKKKATTKAKKVEAKPKSKKTVKKSTKKAEKKKTAKKK